MINVGDTGYLQSDTKRGNLFTVSDIAFHAGHNCTYLYFNGDTRESESGWEIDYFIPAKDELAELKRWKALALARFPTLAEPETDEAAAERFTDQYYGEGGITLAQGFMEAFAWARENVR